MSVDTSSIPSPMRGVCYQPAPTDYNGNQGAEQKYFDTDFFNDDFSGFWSQQDGGRGDLANMADLGINFIHLYDWNPPPARNHVAFLTTCSTLGLGVAVPFNNSFCTNLFGWGANAVYAAMEEIWSNRLVGKPVAMWTIANEYNQSDSPTAAQITQLAQIILYYEAQNPGIPLLPISSPTSFAPATNPGIAPTQALQQAFGASTAFQASINGATVNIPALPADFFAQRYVAATNPQNPGSSPPASAGVTIASWLPQFAQAFPGTPLWFSEIGIGVQNSCNGYSDTCVTSPAQQAAFTLNQLKSADPAKYPFLLGSCIYEYTPDYQNSVVPVPTPPANNYTFSLLSDDNASSPSVTFTIPAGAVIGGTYPVQCLNTSNPVYAAVRGLWNPVGMASPAQWCATPPTSKRDS
jgi:hypothetical protein